MPITSSRKLARTRGVPYLDYTKQRWCRNCQMGINLDRLVNYGSGDRCPRCNQRVRGTRRTLESDGSRAKKEAKFKRY